MIQFAPAKINIGLQVTEKRADGYHNILSIFYPAPWNDVLEILPSKDGSDVFESWGLDIDAAVEDNLCMKTLQLMRKQYAIPAVSMGLLKNIPTGAGLGGGSSDAAAVVRALNQEFKLNIQNEEQERLVLEIGSDCPFFIERKPKLVSGRGEILSPTQLSLAEFHIMLVYPNIHVSTKEAYHNIQPKHATFDLGQIHDLPISQWKDHVVNDFEKGVCELYPEIQKVKDALYDAGADYASMSGSGSAVYGIFSFPPKIEFNNYLTRSGKLD
jgi:4-diphosphocytidyl-2-C-methyl-D-erythritol kinase